MRLSEVYKAVAAGATALAGSEGLVSMLSASDQPVVHAVALGLGVLVGASTWFVRNRATFDQVARALDEDPVVAERVAKKVADDPIVIEHVVRKNPDLVADLIDKYRESH